MKLTVLVALCLLSHSAQAAEAIGKIVGQLGMVTGDVTLDSKAVSTNAPVREGSIVEVKKGKATLLLGTGSVFHLAANSKMIVKQFGMRTDSNKEGGDLELEFGRTRGLILNKGSETKDVKIITRTAVMGVRGTEIFVDAPTDLSKPVQFFTLEGSAVVNAPKIKLVDVKQNQGVASTKGANQEVKITDAVLSVVEVKNDIKRDGMQLARINTPADMGKLRGEYSHESNLNIPGPRFDPILEGRSPVSIMPHYCNGAPGATAGCP